MISHYPKIITDGLVLCLDAGNKTSYSGTGNTWYDLTTNRYNFNFSCVGSSCTNPTYSNNAITTNFDTTSPFNFSYLNGTNLNSKLLQLLYANHTIEMCLKINSLSTVYSYNNALNYENQNGILLWTGYHGGLYIDSSSFIYGIWNGTTNGTSIFTSASSYVGKNIYLQLTRVSNLLSIYINGVLQKSGDIGSTASYTYSNLRIGCGNVLQPTTNSFSWPSKITFNSIKCYNRDLSSLELTQNFQAVKGRYEL